MSEDKRKGPGSATEAPQDRWAATETSLRDCTRCTVCGHVIYSRESIAAGIGPECRRRLKKATQTPAPAVTAMGPAAGVGNQSGGDA